MCHKLSIDSLQTLVLIFFLVLLSWHFWKLRLNYFLLFFKPVVILVLERNYFLCLIFQMLCPLLHPSVNYSLSYIVKVKLLFFRYVALNMLMKAITVDAQAVQRHRATILECVKVLHGLLMFFCLILMKKLGSSISLAVLASFVVPCVWGSNPTFPLPHHLL